MIEIGHYPAIEERVSHFLGRPWRVASATDMDAYASHPSAILTDGGFAVFAKASAEGDGYERLKLEATGLQLLATRAGAHTPTVLGVIPVSGGALLLLEAVSAVERTPARWREIGRALAQLHQVKGTHFGLEMPTYFGPICQDNRPAPDWCTFYAERRLRPALAMAVAAGRLPPEVVCQLEQLITRLPALAGPPVTPALLHGDAQQNNFISTAHGVYLVDPAPYYGHPELDLAYVDFFAPVSHELYAGYQEIEPIAPGFWQRRELWRLWVYLALVALDVPEYLDRLKEAIREVYSQDASAGCAGSRGR